jgi:hypothetical protein
MESAPTCAVAAHVGSGLATGLIRGLQPRAAGALNAPLDVQSGRS